MQYGFGCCCQQLHQLFVPLGLQLMHLLACWAESQPCWECIVPSACCLTELLKELVVRSQKNVRQRAFLVTKHKLLFQEFSCSSFVLCQAAVAVGGLLLFQVEDVWGCPRLCLLGRLRCWCMLAIWLCLLCALGFVHRARFMASHAGVFMVVVCTVAKFSPTHPPFFMSLGLQLMHLLACWAESQPCWECIVPNACCLTELLKELVHGVLKPGH